MTGGINTRRLLALLLLLSVFTLLCACNSETNHEIDKENSASIESPDMNKDAPSEDVIRADVESALYDRNPHISLVEMKTVKSLTQENTYEITLHLSGESRYANWKYEVNLFYTKYDQGWIIDELEWNSENYERVRVPDVEEMVTYITNYLPEHEIYTHLDYLGNAMLPIENTVMNLIYDSTVDEDVLEIIWTTPYNELYSLRTNQFTSRWQYDPYIDNWVLLSSDEHGYDYYFEYIVSSATLDYTLDYSGVWKSDNNYLEAMDIFDTVIISDFTWNGFYAEVPGLEELITIDPYFEKTNTTDFGDTIFTNKEGHYIQFSRGGDFIWIKVYVKDIYIAEAKITGNLPTIS